MYIMRSEVKCKSNDKKIVVIIETTVVRVVLRYNLTGNAEIVVEAELNVVETR